MARLRVLDLFSGIGGFSLGLEATGGFEVVAHCEIEPFCQEILHRYWPQVKLYKDIKELNYGQLETDGLISKQGDIDLICGGYPCQPFSVAGRKGGEEDPRHLWPEYFRLIRELRPRYAVGENVGGHIRLGLDSVLEDLDSEDYTARCFSVEAACIGAPHRRERIFWIAENMAHTESFERGSRQKSGQSKRNASGKCTGNGSSHVPDSPENVEYTDSFRCEQYNETEKETSGRRSETSLGTTGSHVADSHSGCSDRTHKEVRARGKTPDDGSAGAREAETMADPESEFSERSEPEGNSGGQPQAQAGNGSGAVPDTDVEGLEIGEGVGEHPQAELKTSERNDNQKAESNESPVESWVGDGTYGISAWLDGSWEHGLDRVGVNIPQRKAQLMALGNAVVPQLVALVGHAILENHYDA
jgi:DNA-cytosine methyltransferase